MQYFFVILIGVIAYLGTPVIISFFKENMNISVNKKLYYTFIILFCMLLTGIFIATSSNNKDIANNQIEELESKEIQDEKYYIVNGDTIAELLSVDGTISNIWTKKTYKRGEDDAVQFIVQHLLPSKIDMTHFLFTEKRDDENYYAIYNNGVLTIRQSIAEIRENLKSDIKNEISFTGIKFVTIFLAKLEDFSKKIQDYDDSNETLRKELVKFQTKNFPKARKEYFKNAKEQLWEKNIDVKLSGKNITFIGYMFTNNKVIEDTYEEIIDELTKLRFKRVSFQWYDGSETTYWNIESKNDAEI